VAHLTDLITTAKAQSSQQKQQQQQQQMNASVSASTSVNGSRQVTPTVAEVVAPHPPPTSSSLGRYLSEPVENNYLQV
jgi:hypothetical protein